MSGSGVASASRKEVLDLWRGKIGAAAQHRGADNGQVPTQRT